MRGKRKAGAQRVARGDVLATVSFKDRRTGQQSSFTIVRSDSRRIGKVASIYQPHFVARLPHHHPLSPVSGELIEINKRLQERPACMCEAPYGDGFVAILNVKLEERDSAIAAGISSEAYDAQYAPPAS